MQLAEKRQNHTITAYRRLMQLYPKKYEMALRNNFGQSVTYHIIIASKFMKPSETATLCDRYVDSGLLNPKHVDAVREVYCIPAHEGRPYQVSNEWKKKQVENERKWKQAEAQEEDYRKRKGYKKIDL